MKHLTIKIMVSKIILASLVCVTTLSCQRELIEPQDQPEGPVKPAVVSEKVYAEPDDPAIWIDNTNRARSLIFGTDEHANNSGIYVFGLDGKIDQSRSVFQLKRMNNVDVAYGLKWGTNTLDILVGTERERNRIRIFSLPGMRMIDNGGIPVFTGETSRSPMGIATYTRPADGAIFAIISRRTGPLENYLEQYRLGYDGSGAVTATLVRKFGNFSGKKEIEAVAVDNELGFIYYCDEQFGIRKYYADPDKGNEELAVFGQGDFKEDNEGICIYKLDNNTGYILVSDQAANSYNIYPREGSEGNPHLHKKISSVAMSTKQSAGIEVTSESLPGFEGGLFVAMSADTTFQYYRWTDIARKANLKRR